MWALIAVAITVVLVATSILLSLLGNLQQNCDKDKKNNENLLSIPQRIHNIVLWAYGLMLTQSKYILNHHILSFF